MVRVEHVVDSWRGIREETAAAVEEFPEAEFDFRPTPEVSTFRQIARHTLDAGHGLSGMLLAGESNFQGPEFRSKVKAHFLPLAEDCAPRELASALRASLEERAGQLKAQPPEFYGETITRMDGLQLTRLEFLQWIKEHELTHRQQLFMYLRLKGLTPATTRKRQARQAQK